MVKTQSPAKSRALTIRTEVIDRRIYVIRGIKVMLDADLAALYKVPTKAFNQAVKRNLKRFPDDFMFRLTAEEAKRLEASRSQIVTLKRGANLKYVPYVFTEHGVAMLAGVLKSERAIQVNIAIMRAFVKLRQVLADNQELTAKLVLIDEVQQLHGIDIKRIWQTLKKMIDAPRPTRRMGFIVNSR